MNQTIILAIVNKTETANEINSLATRLGYKITSIVDSGLEAIFNAKSEKPDLILIDFSIALKLNRENTVDALQTQIKIPIIFLIPSPEEESIIHSNDLPAFRYIPKPIQKRDFKHAVETTRYVERLNSDHKNQIKALHENEKKGLTLSATSNKELRLAKYSIDNSSNAVFLVNPKGRLHYANKAACSLIERSHQDIIGSFIWEFENGYTPQAFKTHWKTIEKKGTITFESVITNSNGNQIPVEFTNDINNFEGEQYIFSYVTDISERIRSNQECNKMVSVIDQSNDSIVITDPQGNIEYVNRAFEKVTGYSWKEIVGQNMSILKSDACDDQFFLEIWETITSGKTWIGQYFTKGKYNGRIEEHATIFPVLNNKKKIQNFVSVKRDMSEQNKLEQQIRQMQKLEALGTLASGIAHDFNNVLHGIFAYTQLAKRKLADLPENEVVRANLERILSGGSRAKELIDQILTFSRKGDHEPENMDLRPLVKESIKFIKATFPSSISIDLKIDPDVNNIEGDVTQVQQVIINLCTNAFHSMEENGGFLEVSLGNCRVDQGQAETSHLKSGDYVLLSVKDTGIGMNEEVRHRVFEPFFTTKKPGKGTGLGLSTVHGIISNHKGYIEVRSQEGVGSTFDVYLPANNHQPRLQPVAPSATLPKGSESILVVDDEVELCKVNREMLEFQGYSVTTLTRSSDALKAIKDGPFAYDLVITDYMMPHMNGIDLSKEIHKQNPQVPIILLSGVMQQITEDQYQSTGIVAKFSKPVDFESLVKGVREVLDNRSPYFN